jgi:hypothetical protein
MLIKKEAPVKIDRGFFYGIRFFYLNLTYFFDTDLMAPVCG